MAGRSVTPSGMLEVSVGSLLQLPVIRALHKRQLLFPTVVSIVVAGVLVQGALDRSQPQTVTPESASEEPIPAPEPRQILRSGLEKTPLTYVSDYWNQLAEGARGNLVAIGPTAAPGILIGPRLALTTDQPALAVLAERNRVALTRAEPEDAGADHGLGEGDPAEGDGVDVAEDAGETAVEASGPQRLRAFDKELGLALFDVDNAGESAFTLSDPRRLASGSYLGAVTLDAMGEPMITPGYLVTTAADAEHESGDLVVSMDLPSSLSVAAIIDLDGTMVGLAYASETGPRVVTTTEMLGLIQTLQTGTLCRSIEVSDIGDDVRRELGVESGVLVEYVRSEAFSQVASLRGGDVLLEWGDTSLESAEQFASVYDAQASGSLVRYRVLRGRRRVTGGTIMPPRDCEPMTSEPVRFPRFGLAMQWLDASRTDRADRAEMVSSDGWYVVAVAPDGTSAAAGIRELDVLRSVDGQDIEDEGDRAALETAAASEETLLLSLRRDGRAKLIAVPPEAADAMDEVPVEGDVESDR